MDYRKNGKRLLDLILSMLSLIFLSPLMAIIALFIRIDSQGPILFIQERIGKKGKIFRAYKFRSLLHFYRKNDREIFGRDSEATKIGYWLRRFKLDELPQLINVLRGEMSLVGPRPALPKHIAEYDKVAWKRLSVRPGLTGLAQVSGNIYLTWPQRWIYDVIYTEQLSLQLDLWIIFRTIAVLLQGEKKFTKPPSILP